MCFQAPLSHQRAFVVQYVIQQRIGNCFHWEIVDNTQRTIIGYQRLKLLARGHNFSEGILSWASFGIADVTLARMEPTSCICWNCMLVKCWDATSDWDCSTRAKLSGDIIPTRFIVFCFGPGSKCNDAATQVKFLPFKRPHRRCCLTQSGCAAKHQWSQPKKRRLLSDKSRRQSECKPVRQQFAESRVVRFISFNEKWPTLMIVSINKLDEKNKWKLF